MVTPETATTQIPLALESIDTSLEATSYEEHTLPDRASLGYGSDLPVHKLAEKTAQDPQQHLQSLFEQYNQRLLAYATQISGSSHLAEDLVQDAYLRAMKHLAGGGEIRYPVTWLHAIVKHRHIDLVRRPDHRHAVTFSDNEEYERFFGEELPEESLGVMNKGYVFSEDTILAKLIATDILTEAIRTNDLDPIREAVRLKRLRYLLLTTLGYSVPEISKMDDVPEGSIKSSLHRLIAQLQHLRPLLAEAHET